MPISEQARQRVIKHIDEAECLDPDDLATFYRWMKASYETLEFDPVQQQRFDKYCLSSCDSTYMRLYVGVWMLKQTLYKDVSEYASPTSEPA
jgi:hypothetical protein